MKSLDLSSYSLNTWFTKINSSCLIYELIKTLKLLCYLTFMLVFANKSLLSCFYFFLIIELYFLISAVNAQIF